MSATFSMPAPIKSNPGMGRLERWLLLSLVLHAMLLAWAPRLRVKIEDKPQSPSVTVSLRSLPEPAPEPEAAPAPPPEPEVAKPPPTPPPRAGQKKAARDKKPRAAPPQETKAPVIAQTKPAPAAPPVPVEPPVTAAPPTPVAPAPKIAEAPPPPAPAIPATPSTPPTAQSAPLPAETDLAAFVEARRRARGEGADPAAAEAERANRGLLANAVLKPGAQINFPAKKPTANSGWFRIDRRGYDYAEFTFFGWNENFRQNALQLVEVRKGDASSIDVAVIRSVIEIIRRYESGDFNWYSKRLGKTLVLSARPRDQAGLEDFMMQEFADDLRRYR